MSACLAARPFSTRGLLRRDTPRDGIVGKIIPLSVPLYVFLIATKFLSSPDVSVVRYAVDDAGFTERGCEAGECRAIVQGFGKSINAKQIADVHPEKVRS